MAYEYSIIFAFLAMLCWGFGDFLIQKNARKIGDLESLTFIGIIGAIILFPFVIKDLIHLRVLGNLILLLFLGIITFIAGILDFEALKKGKLSVIEVILEIELPITLLLGYFILGERLNIIQLLLIGFIFVGILLIAIRFEFIKNPRRFLEKGVLIGFIGAIVMGLLNFLTGFSAREISPVMAIWAPAVMLSLIGLIIIYKREGYKKLIKNSRRYMILILSMGIIDTLAWLFYAFAMEKNPITITTAITESYPVIGLFLGRFVNKEKIKLYQYFGAGLALMSCVVLAVLI
ncbi:MAG: DMT family transporter [Nanoarchaeota archaeon]|nr:DMT family transporter [Nanoarchaeota archaeon]